MPRKYLTTLCLLLTVTLALPGCRLFFWNQRPNFKSDLTLKICVLPFEDRAMLGGQDINLNISDRLTEKLTEKNTFILVPWSDIEAYVLEKGIPMPLTPNTATMVGRALGLNALVFGAISEVSQISKRTGILSFIPISIPYVSETSDVVTAVLIARVVDVDTGITLGADTGKGVVKTGMNSDDFMIGGPANQVDDEIWETSLDEAVKELAQRVTDALAKTPWKGFIVSVSGDQAVLAAGRESGISTADQFVVYEAGETITNVAGQTYVIPGPVKATLEAVQVEEKTTKLKIINGEVHIGEVVQHTR
jgi:hypothetical protein